VDSEGVKARPVNVIKTRRDGQLPVGRQADRPTSEWATDEPSGHATGAEPRRVL